MTAVKLEVFSFSHRSILEITVLFLPKEIPANKRNDAGQNPNGHTKAGTRPRLGVSFTALIRNPQLAAQPSDHGLIGIFPLIAMGCLGIADEQIFYPYIR